MRALPLLPLLVLFAACGGDGEKIEMTDNSVAYPATATDPDPDPDPDTDTDTDTDTDVAVTADNFVDQYAAALCTFDLTCGPDEFFDIYGDLGECVSFGIDDVAESGFDADRCTFDLDTAETCIERLRSAATGCDASQLDDDSCWRAFDCGKEAPFTGILTELRFLERYFDTFCDLGCTADVSSVCDQPYADFGRLEGCSYDGQAARECVDGDAWTCEVYATGGDGYPRGPDVCFEVYDCGT